jgi:hypothetical protein
MRSQASIVTNNLKVTEATSTALAAFDRSSTLAAEDPMAALFHFQMPQRFVLMKQLVRQSSKLEAGQT